MIFALSLLVSTLTTTFATPVLSRPMGGDSTFTGQLSAEMVENDSSSPFPQPLAPATPEELKLLPVPLAANAHAYRGGLTYMDPTAHNALKPTLVIYFMLVESPTSVVVYVNPRGDSAFTAQDRIVLTDPEPHARVRYEPGDKEGWFSMSLPQLGFLKGYRYHVIYSPARAHADSAELAQHFAMYVLGSNIRTNPPGSRYLWFGELAARGTVTVNGRTIAVQYDVDPTTGKIHSTDDGQYGMDVDGDGRINVRSQAELQYRRPGSNPVVFHVGDMYLSPGPVDQTTGRFVVTQVAANTYTLLDLTPGKPFPNVPFTDLQGQSHTLTDFHGKYVLLDFWEFGCGPCREDMPYMEKAYEQYKARGFEIVGFDVDDTSMLSSVKDLVHEKGLTWLQASSAIAGARGKALAYLINNQLRIHEYPTVILLAPDGTIASVDESQIRGPALAQTLDRLLPPKPTGT